MASFTFSKKILKGSLDSPQPNVPSYTIKTKLQWWDNERKTTTLLPNTPNSSGKSLVLEGMITWKKDEFKIGEVTRKCAELKTIPEGKMVSNVRDWQWLGPERTYRLAYDKHLWTATHKGSDRPSVKFITGKSHTYKANEPASIEFTPDVYHEEVLFLTLVMIYSETRRKDKIAGAVGGVIGILGCIGSCVDGQ